MSWAEPALGLQAAVLTRLLAKDTSIPQVAGLGAQPPAWSPRAMSFSLNLKATGEDIGAAAFHALVAAGWVMFNTMQMLWAAQSPGVGLAPLETRERWARDAFALVGGHLPEDNPYARELRRYVAEEVPVLLRRNTPPTTFN